MRRIFFLMTAYWMVAASAAAGFCSSEFMALTPQGRLELVRQTHAELLDKLGGRLTVDELREMADSKNPFVLPAKMTNANEALDKHLWEFQLLLMKQGWDTTETRTALLADLKRRSQAGLRQAETRREALRLADRGSLVTIGKRVLSLGGPGRYVLASNPREPELVVYDLEQQKLLPPVMLPNMELNAAVLSPAGDFLIVPMDGGTFKKMPFVDGVPQPDKSFDLGKYHRDLSFGQMHFPWPGVGLAAITSKLNSVELFRFDLQTGERKKVRLEDFDESLRGKRLWVAGATGEVWLLQALDGKRIWKYEVSANGIATRVPGEAIFGSLSSMNWSPDARSLLLMGTGLQPWANPKWKVVPLAYPIGPGPEAYTVQSIAVHPSQDKAVALVRSEKGATILIWYDAKTGTELGRKLIPRKENFAEIQFTPDGQRYLMNTKNSTQYLIGPVESIEP